MRRDRAAWALAVIVSLALVMAPALWNGFPILYPDIGGYLARPIEHNLELGRSALYGLFLLAGAPLAFWPNVLAQAALIVWLIARTLRCHRPGAKPWLVVAVVFGLCLASALPWYVSTLQPDILLPAAVLAMLLLAFGGDRLRCFEVLGLVAVIVLAIASHMGTLALCLGLLVALALLRWLQLPRSRLALPAFATAAGLLLAPLSNFAITGQFAFTPGGETFLFGRLVQDGIVQRYLADHCPDQSIRLCAYKDRMPATADEWLWAPGNPIGELGGWRGYAAEERRIILDTLRLYPGEHLKTALRSTAQQLTMMQTDVSLVPDWIAPGLTAMRRLEPQLMPPIEASRQIAQADSFAKFLARLNVVHVGVAALAILALLAIALFGRHCKIEPPTVAGAWFVLIALAGNAAICGIFSNPVDRYQSRIVWLAPLAVAVAVASRKDARRAP